jgi:acetylornithine deacetylase/succinyl-diaminopimelate desuccinylase-like protein
MTEPGAVDASALAEALRVARAGRATAVDELVELCAIPSVSALPAHRGDVRAAAEWAADRLRRLGMEVEVLEGSVHPVVLAHWLGRPGAPVLGIYNHFDVQPADPLGEWTSPPFEPQVRDGFVYARGVSDNKGSLVAGVKALEALFAAGAPPVNLRVFYEGEEEVTGPSLGECLREHRDRLATDYLLLADGEFDGVGLPGMLTGLRGVLQFQIEAVGAAADLHSGLYGGVAPNPLNSLAHILSGLKGPDGRIAIPGFYDDVRLPSADELAQWPSAEEVEAGVVGEIGAVALEGEAEHSVLERLWTRPTLDVHGIVGGFMEEGTKTVIPARAVAKVSMRLVPDQDPARILPALVARVEELATPGVQVRVTDLGRGRPALFGIDHAGVGAAQRAFEATFGSPARLRRMGASVPVAADFQEVLGAKMIVTGFGLPGDGYHSPDEHFAIDQLHGATEMIVRLAHELAATPGP